MIIATLYQQIPEKIETIPTVKEIADYIGCVWLPEAIKEALKIFEHRTDFEVELMFSSGQYNSNDVRITEVNIN